MTAPPGAEQVRVSMDRLIEAMWQAGGTDLHISGGMVPKIRVEGHLRDVPGADRLLPAQIDRLLAEVLTEEQIERCRTGEGDLDFSFGWRHTARIRGNVFRQRSSLAAALRMMPQEVPTFDQLRLPEPVRRFAQASQGLVLVTGPTGSGKSTTLAAMIAWIAANQAKHIITIEDPIEFVHRHGHSVVNQRAVGEDAPSFAEALRSALREDPDVLLVGELRDLESIRVALTLAETGHLVFGTVHTNDAVQSIDRIVDVFPSEEQSQTRTLLALSLTGVVYQRLLPRVGGGVVAAFEVMAVNSSLRNLIREGRTSQMRNQLVVGQAEGMMTLERSLSELVEEGLVTYQDAVARSRHPADITRRRGF
jgi:twitching motility protein PilT